MRNFPRKTFATGQNPREGVLPEKLVGGVRSAYPNSYPINDQNLRFDQKFDTLFMTVAAATVALNIIYEGLLLMVLSIMMKK